MSFFAGAGNTSHADHTRPRRSIGVIPLPPSVFPLLPAAIPLGPAAICLPPSALPLPPSAIPLRAALIAMPPSAKPERILPTTLAVSKFLRFVSHLQPNSSISQQSTTAIQRWREFSSRHHSDLTLASWTRSALLSRFGLDSAGLANSSGKSGGNISSSSTASSTSLSLTSLFSYAERSLLLSKFVWSHLSESCRQTANATQDRSSCGGHSKTNLTWSQLYVDRLWGSRSRSGVSASDDNATAPAQRSDALLSKWTALAVYTRETAASGRAAMGTASSQWASFSRSARHGGLWALADGYSRRAAEAAANHTSAAVAQSLPAKWASFVRRCGGEGNWLSSSARRASEVYGSGSSAVATLSSAGLRAWRHWSLSASALCGGNVDPALQNSTALWRNERVRTAICSGGHEIGRWMKLAQTS